MRVAHVLRKYDPTEWGGTETALQRLFAGLSPQGVTPVIFHPRRQGAPGEVRDPFAEAGYGLRAFRASVPVWGMNAAQRRQWIAVGGNLMSFDLPAKLWREPGLDAIHTHCLGRLGAMAGAVARARRLPLVVTIHGGVLDLPPAVKQGFDAPHPRGWEWGKVFGWLLRARQLLARADAILTCNPREAQLLQKQYPDHRIEVQPHGVAWRHFQEPNQRPAALAAFPQLNGRQILLVVGRIDPVKNQSWLLDQMPELLRQHPQALLVLVGACTDQDYGARLVKTIHRLGIEQQILLTGGISPADRRLIGLFQSAAAVILPSISETFGLVILEAWAAKAVPIASRTSGSMSLIQPGQNGWLFDLNDPATFHAAISQTLRQPTLALRMAAAGHQIVREQFDPDALADRLKQLYQLLIDQKRALRHSPR